MTPAELASKAIARFNESITDQLFVMIESDPELMQDYLRAVSDHSLDTVNQTIGKAVKAAYDLENKEECHEPTSFLIKSFMTYKPK